MNNPLLEVRELSHRFLLEDDTLEVIKSITFSLSSGSILGILGPSGCGKSTVLNCIAGLIEPEKGTITIDGLHPKKAQNSKKIGIAFQEENLLDWLTVKDNILLPIKIGMPSPPLLSEYEKLIEIIGLKKFEGYYPSQLSGGMKQRVILARALITNPQILLLDEPFSAIDLLTRTKLMIEFYEIIKKLNATTIIVTHSITEAVYMSDELMILKDIPTGIREQIPIQFNTKRDIDLFQNSEYISKVNYCRKLLMQE